MSDRPFTLSYRAFSFVGRSLCHTIVLPYVTFIYCKFTLKNTTKPK